MRRAWLLALLAVPVVGAAQTPPPPAAGSITVGDVLHTSTDGFINAAECNGPGTVHLSWRVALAAGRTSQAGSVDYQLYASNKEKTTDTATEPCFKDNGEGGDDSIRAGPVATLDDEPLEQVIDQEFLTSVIAAQAGRQCDETTSETIFLCVKATDSQGLLGSARGRLTLDRRAPASPEDSVSAGPGESALNVKWDEVTSSPPAEYYIVDAQQVGTTTAAFDPTPIHTSGPVTGSKHRFGGLVNTVVYQVRVFAFSTADNSSTWDPAVVVTGTPQAVNDFWEEYQAQGGREQGGCASGSAGLLGLAAVGALIALRRRRS